MNEFSHYPGCGMKDPDNCSGCALTTGGPEGPNYAGWPISYEMFGRRIPTKWKNAFELQRQSDNRSYAEGLEAMVDAGRITFSDGSKPQKRAAP